MAKVLMLDDDELSLRSFERCFATTYEVTTVASPKRALELIGREKFDVALVDYVMPEMTGVEFLEKAMTICPTMARALVTGHSDVPEVLSALTQGVVATVILKPWAKETIIEWVDGQTCKPGATAS